ncbi:MAG: hypothetical protein WC516_03200 [Patescibacteria group bacterium]
MPANVDECDHQEHSALPRATTTEQKRGRGGNPLACIEKEK